MAVWLPKREHAAVHVLPIPVVRRTLVLGLLLLGLLAALVPTAAPARAETAPLGARVGFSPGGAWPWLPDAELARELDLMASSGATWVRVDFSWSSVERVRGTYDWKNLDRVVAAVRSRGMQVLALPAYTPEWARPAGTTNKTPPTDPTGFAAFTAAAAARYVPHGVTVYEIWNEPNIAPFWAPKPDVAAYARLLELTSAKVRAVAPSAVLVVGGLSPASDLADGTRVDPRTFLTKLYALGAGSSFDAVGVHPYSFPALPSDETTASWNTFQKMSTMRETMIANGDGAKRIWLTETGAPTGTSSQAVSEARQAAIVADTLTAVAGLSWAGPVFFYSLRDRGTNLGDREDNFGLLRRDFGAKPAWSALLAGLGGTIAAPTAGLTTAPPTTTSPTAGFTKYRLSRAGTDGRRSFGPRTLVLRR